MLLSDGAISGCRSRQAALPGLTQSELVRSRRITSEKCHDSAQVRVRPETANRRAHSTMSYRGDVTRPTWKSLRSGTSSARSTVECLPTS
jgi:hypothetical protein